MIQSSNPMFIVRTLIWDRRFSVCSTFIMNTGQGHPPILHWPTEWKQLKYSQNATSIFQDLHSQHFREQHLSLRKIINTLATLSNGGRSNVCGPMLVIRTDSMIFCLFSFTRYSIWIYHTLNSWSQSIRIAKQKGGISYQVCSDVTSEIKRNGATLWFWPDWHANKR